MRSRVTHMNVHRYFKTNVGEYHDVSFSLRGDDMRVKYTETLWGEETSTETEFALSEADISRVPQAAAAAFLVMILVTVQMWRLMDRDTLMLVQQLAGARSPCWHAMRLADCGVHAGRACLSTLIRSPPWHTWAVHQCLRHLSPRTAACFEC